MSIWKDFEDSGKPEPYRALVYGVSGVGKTSWAARAPAPAFISGDGNGLKRLRIRPYIPRTWTDVFAAVRNIGDGGTGKQTIVFDTINWLEPLCQAHVCAVNKWKSIDDKEASYGRGYAAQLDEFRKLIVELERCVDDAGVNVIFLAHSAKKLFKNPEGDDFERYVPDMHEKSWALICQWCDVVMFARHELAVHKDAGKRVRGVSSGARIVHTEWRPAFEAKNRYGMPPTMALDYDTFAAYLTGSATETPSAVRERIGGMVNELNDGDLALKVAQYIRDAGDSLPRLAQIENAVQAKLQERAA